MLEAMGLGRYRESFEREQVSGDILMELGEEDLKAELGMESKLHRYGIEIHLKYWL